METLKPKWDALSALGIEFRASAPISASLTYVGQTSKRGEQANAVELFRRDPFGCRDPGLLAKRAARDPFHRAEPYALSCPELAGLLSWCGPAPYPGLLPWMPDRR